MPSQAKTVSEYLAALPADRRAALQKVRAVIRKNLDKSIVEGIQYGMIGYWVPHSVYPDGYHTDPKQPLPFASLASQKQHMAVYLFAIYTSNDDRETFQANWKKTGKKLDMGKSCVRFKKIEDVPLEVVGSAIRRMTLKRYLGLYEQAFGARRTNKPAKKAAAKKTAKK